MKQIFNLLLSIILLSTIVKCLPPLKDTKYHNFTRVNVTTDMDSVLYTDFYNYDIVKQSSKSKVSATKKNKKKSHKVDKIVTHKTKDYLGSIEIPAIGTKEAIYKGKEDYYLYNNYLGNNDELGEVYVDDRTGNRLGKNGTLLNGHAVPNGTKFGSFKKLLNVDKQPTIFIWDNKEQETVEYKMLFVSLIDGGTSGIVMEFKSDKERYLYYMSLYSTSIKKWAEPVENSNFMLLNSCSYIIKNGHYVVVAERVV